MRRHDHSLPSPFRCLHGLRLAAAALIVMLGLFAVERTACTVLGPRSTFCEALQVPYTWWLLAACVAGILYTLYAAYRDFFKGRYYSDLAKLQQY